MNIKDTDQKNLLLRHFSSQGAYVHLEVPVFHKEGIHKQVKNITDIDVLALRLGINLKWDRIIGDCKTKKSESPVNRVLWLRGLMAHFSASGGIIVLQKNQRIENDHKLFAASLNIILLDEEEFTLYDRAIVYPSGSKDFPMSTDFISELRFLYKKYRPFESFCEYIYGSCWNEPQYINLLRKVIGESKSISGEIDPSKNEHLSLVLDAASTFAVGLAECVGIVFNQYLLPSSQSQLDEALKMVIWGGRSNYEYISRIRQEIAKGRNNIASTELALPFWDEFLHLVRSMLENPMLAFSIPQLLRRSSVDILYSQPFFIYNKRRRSSTYKILYVNNELPLSSF